MSRTRTPLQAAAAVERRPPVSAVVARSAAASARSPAHALQSRLGNRATQAFVSRSLAANAVQCSPKADRPLTKVSRPHDPAELEAEDTARKVARMNEPPAVAP